MLASESAPRRRINWLVVLAGVLFVAVVVAAALKARNEPPHEIVTPFDQYVRAEAVLRAGSLP